MQLQLQAYDAGLFDLWEVHLIPAPGIRSGPLSVVVPARDSRAATAMALQQYPGFISGAVRRVSRK
jgi:hypothetical protein